MIPLAAGGFGLQDSCRGISEIDGDFLRITIPAWLAEKLGIHEGSWVQVDNQDGKFNIRLSTDPHVI
jgi:predicted molibdopterin-dependent oxidoreductase YjgC